GAAGAALVAGAAAAGFLVAVPGVRPGHGGLPAPRSGASCRHPPAALGGARLLRVRSVLPGRRPAAGADGARRDLRRRDGGGLDSERRGAVHRTARALRSLRGGLRETPPRPPPGGAGAPPARGARPGPRGGRLWGRGGTRGG